MNPFQFLVLPYRTVLVSHSAQPCHADARKRNWKAQWLLVRQLSPKPCPHLQQSRSNIRLCWQKRQQCRTKFCSFDKVETNWCVRFVSTLSKGRNFVGHCCHFWQKR